MFTEEGCASKVAFVTADGVLKLRIGKIPFDGVVPVGVAGVVAMVVEVAIRDVTPERRRPHDEDTGWKGKSASSHKIDLFGGDVFAFSPKDERGKVRGRIRRENGEGAYAWHGLPYGERLEMPGGSPRGFEMLFVCASKTMSDDELDKLLENVNVGFQRHQSDVLVFALPVGNAGFKLPAKELGEGEGLEPCNAACAGV